MYKIENERIARFAEKERRIVEKLDKKDKRILFMLDHNSRLPASIIAKKVGLSREGVKYRIDQLIKKQIILGFIPSLNLNKIGFHCFLVKWDIEHFSPEKEKKFIAYLKASPYITRVIRISGLFDFHTEIWAMDNAHFDEILTDIRTKFSDIIHEYETFMALEEHVLKAVPDGFFADLEKEKS